MKQCLPFLFFCAITFQSIAQTCPPHGQVASPCFQVGRPVFPEQDCCGAIALCNALNIVPNNQILGPGCVGAELPSSLNTCLTLNENRTTWYTFEIRPLPGGPTAPGSQAGLLRVVILPNDLDSITPGDNGLISRGTLDYDFALFDITLFGDEKAAACAAIKASTAVGTSGTIQLSCNYSGFTGPTGLLEPGTGDNGGNRYNRPLAVTVGQRFILAVDNFSSNQFGYKILFDGLPIPLGAIPTAVVVPPRVDSIRFANLRTPTCADSTLLVTFSHPVSCESIQGSLRVTDATTGANITVDSIVPYLGCNVDRQDTTFRIVFQGFVPGRTYRLVNTGLITDICGNSLDADSIFFTYLGEQFTSLISNNGGVLISDISAGVTFQWYRNGTLIPGATDPTFTLTQAGTYFLEIRNTSGCVAQSNQIVITSSLLKGKSTVQVFPNPSDGTFNIVLNGQQDFSSLKVMDARGRLMLNEKIVQGAAQHQFHLQTSGVYSLELIGNKSSFHQRVVVK